MKILSSVNNNDIELLINNPESFWKDIEFIDDEVFCFNDNLKEIFIPDNVIGIGKQAFYSCKYLKNIRLPSRITEINENTFAYCINLEKVEIPSSVGKIDFWAFHYCENLKEIIFNEGLNKIESGAFLGCNKIDEVEIPNSVDNISPYAFNFVKLKYLVEKKDGKLAFSSSSENCVNFYSIDKIFEIFPNLNLGLIIHNYHRLKPLLDNINYINTMVPEFLVSTVNDLEKVLNSDFKIMKNLIKLLPKDLDKENILALYKLANCMGIFENEKVVITINGRKISVRDFAYTVLQGAFNRGDINFYELNSSFGNLGFEEYNEEFLKFMSNKVNLSELKIIECEQKGFTGKVYSWFKGRKYWKIDASVSREDGYPSSEENRYKIRTYDTSNNGIDKIKWKSPTVSLLQKEFSERKFIGITSENEDIAEYLSSFNLYGQRHFDKAVEIDEERRKSGVRDHLTTLVIKEDLIDSLEDYKKRTYDIRKSIIGQMGDVSKIQTDTSSRIFTYEMLAKSDKANFAIGLLTSCCATLYGSGGGAQRAMILHPDMQPLVIKNIQGNIIALGIIYVNREEGYAVVNNFEVNKKYGRDEEALKEIYTKAMQGVDAFVSQYNRENSNKPINIVTCGISPNWDAINDYISKHPKSSILKAPDFDDFKYVGGGHWSGDWHKTQYIIWKNIRSKK